MSNTPHQRPKNNFIPLGKIPIDIEFSLEQMTGRFQTLKDGLPELIKNSKDHYERLHILDKNDRLIIIIFSKDLDKIGVLDFGGAKLEDFDGWQTWSSRLSGRNEMGMNIEAGYGNGGKAFMVRGVLKKSSMCGYNSRRLNKMGYILNDPNQRIYEPGFYSDNSGRELKDYYIHKLDEALNHELEPFGIDLNDLPEEALILLKRREAFTIVYLDGIKEWKNYTRSDRKRACLDIEMKIAEHAQAALTIDTCHVMIFNAYTKEEIGPLEVTPLEPFEGLEKIAPIPVPDLLIDPETKNKIGTGPDPNNKKFLILRTSKLNLRSYERYKSRNVIRVKNERNVVSNWSIAELVPEPSSGYVYGAITCPALIGEHLSGSDRLSPLVDTPLVRALREWTSEQVGKIVSQIQALRSDTYRNEDTSAASETLKLLRDLMKDYLKKETAANQPADTGETPGGKKKSLLPPPPPPPPKKYGKRIDEILLESPGDWIKIALGTNIPLIVRCYEKNGEERLPINTYNLHLVTNVDGIIEHNQRVSIRGLKTGTIQIYFEDNKTGIKSNSITIEVVELSELVIQSPTRKIKQSERLKLDISAFALDKSRVSNLLYETSIDEIDMGKISRNGFFTAGGKAGETTVRIRWGNDETKISSCKIVVSEEKIERPGKDSGSDIPDILFCNTLVPGLEDLPENQRTHPGGAEYASIIDVDPLWEDKVVWINQHSREAKAVRNRKGRYIKLKSKTFQVFVMIKCFEILKRLIIRQKNKDLLKTVPGFIFELSEVEMDNSEFIDKAYKIIEKLIEQGGVSEGDDDEG